jgi:maleylpyruvate isomerase
MLPGVGKGPQARDSIIFDYEGAPCTDSKYHRHWRGRCRGVPSLRRELEYHHVDLAAGYQPADWPGDIVAMELSRVTALMDRRADAPPMTLTSSGALHVGSSPRVDVIGPPAALLAWLSGRSDGSGLHSGAAAPPVLPPLA